MDVYGVKQFKELVEGNPYPGRGIILGLNPEADKLVSAYFIMGRSENSRNRVFVKNGDDLLIIPFDESKVEDPSLIIYYPLRVYKDYLIVTNGDQTDTIRDYLDRQETFADALRSRAFEPDSPNWTPRISGIAWIDHKKIPYYKMSILKAGDPDGIICSRYFYEYEGAPGLGHFIHTYVTDGNPIPTFQGEPKRVEIPDDINSFAEEIWTSLDEANKISLYVRYTDINTGEYEDILINKHQKEEI